MDGLLCTVRIVRENGYLFSKKSIKSVAKMMLLEGILKNGYTTFKWKMTRVFTLWFFVLFHCFTRRWTDVFSVVQNCGDRARGSSGWIDVIVHENERGSSAFWGRKSLSRYCYKTIFCFSHFYVASYVRFQGFRQASKILRHIDFWCLINWGSVY